MKLKRVPVLISFLGLVLASLACSALATTGSVPTKQPHIKATPTPVPGATPTHDPNAPALPPTVSPDTSGIACLGLRDGGLSCLDSDGWKTYAKDDQNGSGIVNNYIPKGTVCPKDHRVAIAVSDGISLFDGTKWEHISKPDDYTAVDAIACGEDNEIWVAYYGGVSQYKDSKWKAYKSSKLATGDYANNLVINVAVDTDNNKVWVATARSVAMLEDDKWTVYQKGQGFDQDLFFQAMVLDSSGRPWVAYGTGVAVLDSNTWKLISRPGYDAIKDMSFDAKGRLWLATLNHGAAMYDGNSWVYYNVKGRDLASDHTNAVTTDSRGRVWLSTTYGLSVFDNDKWQTYTMDNSDIADNIVQFAAVVKDGPSVPDTDNKIKASITGTLKDADKKALEGITVELCAEPIDTHFTTDTPCTDQPFFLSTTTDKDGKFTFDSVLPGYYVITAQTKSGWVILTKQVGDGTERTLLEPGKDYDAGSLNVDDETAIVH